MSNSSENHPTLQPSAANVRGSEVVHAGEDLSAPTTTATTTIAAAEIMGNDFSSTNYEESAFSSKAPQHEFPNAVFEDVLMMSDFLTTFHSNFCIDDESDDDSDTGPSTNPTKAPASDATDTCTYTSKSKLISPWDLVSAIQYRNDIKSYHHIEALIHMLPSSKVKTQLKDKLKIKEEQIWIDMQNRISKDKRRFSRDEDTIQLVQNYEVWMTKKVATEFLLFRPSTNGKKGQVYYPSCSTLLNMASGDYCSWANPRCKVELVDINKQHRQKRQNNDNEKQNDDQDDPMNDSTKDPSKIPNMKKNYRGTLALPPNSLTWKEYLRLSIMVSSLSMESKDAIQQASKSTMTQSIFINPEEGFNPEQPAKLNTSTKKQTVEILPKHTPADLVALWVRAQRNTSAFLHLIDLFAVRKVKKPKPRKPSKKNMNSQDYYTAETKNSNDNDESYTTNDANDEYYAKYVGNFKKVKSRIEKEAALVDNLMNWAITNQVMYTHKRMRQDVFDEMSKQISKSDSNKSKRKRNDYARSASKRRKYNPNLKPLAIHDVKVQRAIKVFILRLFARRNRNVLSLVYLKDVNTSHTTKGNKSLSLSIIKDIPDKIKQYMKIHCNGSTDRTLARIDRRIILEKFEDEGSFQDAVDSLLNALRFAIPDENKEFLEELDFAQKDFKVICDELLRDKNQEPSPMLRKFDLTDGDALYEQFLSLPCPWVEKCFSCNEDKSDEDMKFCSACEKYYHPRSHGNTLGFKPLSECTMLSPFYWSPLYAKELPESPDFTRNDGQTNWTRKTIELKRDVQQCWGVLLYISEHCSASLKETESWLQDGKDIVPLLRKVRDPPLRVPFVGLIAFSVHEGKPAALSGLTAGDVIIEAESNGVKYNFSKMKESEMMEVFKSTTESIHLTVYRSSTNLIKRSEDFHTSVVAMTKKVEETHRMCLKDRDYCGQCTQPSLISDDTKDSEKKKIIKEAKLCLALIGRLSLEWRSLPFNNEVVRMDSKEGSSISDSGINHSSHTSLQRLHEMMNYIIADNLNQPLSDRSPFLVPTSNGGTNQFKETLLWAKGFETKPFFLLCRGVDNMLKSKSFDESSMAHQQHLLFKDLFIKFFVSWCLDSQMFRIEPPSLFMSIEPWVLVSSLPINGHINVNQSDDFFVDHPSIDQLQYDFYSSFVGSTILVLPNDPLLRLFEKKANFMLENSHGPFLLLVVSFVPSFYFTKELGDGMVREQSSGATVSDEVGLYYLIPLISINQLTYILQFCKIEDMSTRSPSWFNLEVFNIPGIFALTPNELEERMRNSKKILGAIDKAIYQARNKDIDASRENEDFFNEKHHIGESSINTNQFGGEMVYSFDCDFWSSDPISSLSAVSEKDSNVPMRSLSSVSRTLALLNEALFMDRNLFDSFPIPKTSAMLLDEDLSHVVAHTTYTPEKRLSEANVCSLNAKFLHGLILFRNDESISNRSCKLCYSDLLYWEFKNARKGFWTRKKCESMKKMEQIVHHQTLQNPLSRQNFGQTQSLQLLLQRIDVREISNDSDSEYEDDESVTYEGIGWGFEIVQWVGDNDNFRFGRIAPNSPAFQAGFKVNDILKSINGVSTSEIRCLHTLCQQLLGEKDQNELQYKHTEYPHIASLHRLTKPVIGPIFIEVLREQCVASSSHTKYLQHAKKRGDQISNGNADATTLCINHSLPPTMLTERESTSLEQSKNATSTRSITQDLAANESSNVPNNFGGSSSTNAIADALRRVSSVIQQSKARRQYLDSIHLYQAGVAGSIFTLAETSVFLTALEKGQPKLGMRLLYPRYRKSIIKNEFSSKVVPMVRKDELYSVPVLTENLWMCILRADWERSLNESGDVIEIEGKFEYKEATEVLPIDRLCEEIFKEWRNGGVCNEGDFLPRMFDEIQGRRSDYQLDNGRDPHHRHHLPPPRRHIHTYMQHPPPPPPTQHRSWESHDHLYNNSNRNTTYSPISTPRIRGGGDEDSKSDSNFCQALITIPKAEWSGIPIYGGCTVTQNGVNTIDVCLGRVLHPHLSESNAADVAIFFLASRGKFKARCSIDAGNLFIIPNCKGQDDNCVITTYTQHKEKIQSHIMSQYTQEEANEVSKTDRSFLVSCTLGYLPDNRIVYWFHCDPTAIYLRHENNTEALLLNHQKFSADVNSFNDLMQRKNRKISFNLSCEKKRYHCIWGCSQAMNGNMKNRKLLGFDTEDALKNHYKQHHSYEILSTDWERVNEGDSMKQFCTDLTSHICSKSWVMSRFGRVSSTVDNNSHFYKSPFGTKFSFDREKVLNLFENRDYLRFVERGLVTSDTNDLMKLLRKLFQLFAVETSGSFCHSDLLFNSAARNGEARWKDSDESEDAILRHLEKDVVERTKSSPLCTKILECTKQSFCSFNELDPKQQMNCRTCRTSDENAMKSFSEKIPKVHGIGCALPSDLYGYKANTSQFGWVNDVFRSLSARKGELLDTKALLLKVASKVPETLYLCFQNDTQHSIWNGQNIEIWIAFVECCVNCQMLTQAFIMLLNSVDKNKLPMWWKCAKSGWGSSFALVQNLSFSSLALNLFAFDLAVSSSERSSDESSEDKSVMEGGFNKSDDSSIPEAVEISTPAMEKISQNGKKSYDEDENTNDVQSFQDDFYEEHEDMSPKRMTTLSLYLKMNRVLKWADEESIGRFKGVPKRKCLRCGHTGHVLQCELCENVVHKGCVGFEGPSTDFKVVCDECINFWYSKKQEEAEEAVRKMKQVIRWAKEENSPTYEGEHSDDCMYCDEEGQVLLCEFCPNVAHQECIGYQGNLDDIDYVCRVCVDRWFENRHTESAKPIPSYIPCDEEPKFTSSSPLILKFKLVKDETSPMEDEVDDESVEDGINTQLVLEENENQMEEISLLGTPEESNDTSHHEINSDDSITFEESEEKSALNEYLERGARLQSDHGLRCKLLLSCTDVDKMKYVMKWGDEKGIPRGLKNNDYCHVCGNGKGLSAWNKCEFCENVIHRECCQLQGDFDRNEYVCHECIIDILDAVAAY